MLIYARKRDSHGVYDIHEIPFADQDAVRVEWDVVGFLTTPDLYRQARREVLSVLWQMHPEANK